MKILGISGLYHDSAAALCVDGEIIAAAQEERFSRVKHDTRFPKMAIQFCLDEAGILPEFLDMAVYYDNPFLTLDRWTNNLLNVESDTLDEFVNRSFNSVFKEKLWINKLAESHMGTFAMSGKLQVVKHHISHASSAFYPSPFESAAVLTIDGVGEWATTAISHGNGTKLDMLAQINYPDSLGLLYAAFTYFCGFKVNSGEYKLMGLAPYGDPVYADIIRDNLIDIRQDGSYSINMEYFDYFNGGMMTNDKFSALFGGGPRSRESKITRREMNLAASIQKVTEEAVILLAQQAKRMTGEYNLCMAGGVALNCVANGTLLNKKLFKKIWVQPASGDAGGAIGAALYAEYNIGKGKRKTTGRDFQKGSFLGPRFSEASIISELDKLNAKYIIYKDKDNLYKKAAKLVSGGGILGFFNGRAEFGPRALGARSIIASPCDVEMQSRLNLKIKFRESFRPFAPAVLAEKASEWFETDCESPYMLFVVDVKRDKLKEFDLNKHMGLDDDAPDMLSIVNTIRSVIPAVTHVDNSARIQTVNKADNPDFYALIEQFEKLKGCPMVVNTSFNVRGEPIVNTPSDAYRCFIRTGMDALIIENVLLLKEEQPDFVEIKDWRNEYGLD